MNEQHYAVVVGIDHYPGVSHLTSARNDARRFADWLKQDDGGGLPEENIELVLVDDTGDLLEPLDVSRAEPRFQQVEDALFDLLLKCEERVAENPLDWEKTRLYLYVSGHGIAPAPDEAALLMANAGPRRYGRNLSCDKFLEFFKAAQTFHELVFFADCCREFVGNAPIQAPTWDKVKGNNGPVVALPGYATHFGKLAFEVPPAEDEPPDSRRSYFTKALLEGLSGKAVNDEGTIDSTSLALYVTDRVKILTANMRSPQEPQMPSDPAAPIVFRTGLPTSASSPAAASAPDGLEVTLHFPTGFTGTVELFDGTLKKLDSHDTADGPWQLRLPRGLYEVLPAANGNSASFANDGRFKVLAGGRDVQL